MESYIAKINQLVLEDQSPKSKFVIKSFIARQTNNVTDRYGKIFGLIEFESQNSKIVELAELIAGDIEENFYSQTEELSINTAEDLESTFESALQKTNLSIAAFLESEQIKIDLNKINIAIGLVLDRSIYFTVVGNVNIFLFKKMPSLDYRIIDIINASKTPIDLPDPLKLFSQIINGKINNNDIVFITTPTLLDYFSLDKIKNIMTEKEMLNENVIEFKRTISNLGINTTLGSMMLKLEKQLKVTEVNSDLINFDYQEAASKDSMKELIRTESETAKLLTPSIMPEIRKYTKVFSEAFQNYLSKIKESSNKKSVHLPRVNMSRQKNDKIKEEKIKVKKHIQKIDVRQKVNNVNKKIARITAPIKNGLNLFDLPKINKLPNISKIFIPFKKLLDYGFMKKFYAKFSNLPKSSKILLVVSVIFAVLFVQSVIWLGFKNKSQKEVEAFNSAIVEIENRKNEAEASLIYRDENKAREYLIEAKNLLDSLNPKNKSQEQQANLLEDALQRQINKLSHLVEIQDPIFINNFENFDSEANTATVLLTIGDEAYTQNQNNKSIYRANIDSKAIAGLLPEGVDSNNFITGIADENNELIFLDDNNNLFRFNPQNNSINKLTISLPENSKIVDIAEYGGRLYLLDVNNSQIYRYSRATTGYINKVDWIKDNRVDLSDATSFDIDGSVYVLNKSGQVLLLRQGELVNFQTAKVDPPIQNATKLKTNAASDFIYILDPNSKRVIVLDKEGNLASQYTSDGFDNLKDFSIFEDQKRIYVLNKNSVFGIPVEHLE